MVKDYENRGIILGLDNMQNILNILDNPQKNYKIIHITGTNGKGSVSEMICKGLVKSYNTYKFSSPHINNINEQFNYNGYEVRLDVINNYIDKIDKICNKNDIKLTMFELSCVVLFLHAGDLKVDYVVLEAGLGGLNDATNIADGDISVITNISLDHTDFLGNSLDLICQNKLGIVKPKSKVFTGYDKVILKNIKINNFERLNVDYNYDIKYLNLGFEIKINNNKFKILNVGSYQINNFILAYEVLKYLNIPDDIINQSISTYIFPRRFELINNIIYDAAHNPDGFRALKQTIIDYKLRDIALLVGFLINKDYNACLSEILPYVSNIIFTSTAGPRGMDPSELNNINLDDKIKIISDNDIAMDYLISLNSQTKIITGSFNMFKNN